SSFSPFRMEGSAGSKVYGMLPPVGSLRDSKRRRTVHLYIGEVEVGELGRRVGKGLSPVHGPDEALLLQAERVAPLLFDETRCAGGFRPAELEDIRFADLRQQRRAPPLPATQDLDVAEVGVSESPIGG